MADRRILLLSHAFPPMWAPEALLSAKRMGALPGFEVDVVCAQPPAAWAGAATLDAYVEQRFGRVERVARSRIWDHARFSRFTGVVRPPDEFRWFNGPARRAALRLAGERSYEAIVSWSQPHSTHLVAQAVAGSTGLPWIAHFSDPWVRNPFLSLEGLERRLNERQERGVFAAADRLLFTSAHTVDLCLAGYPAGWRDKARVLPHAFDPSLYGDTPSPPTGGRLTLRYLGAFYRPRTPAPLLAALRLLEPALRERLNVEIVGRVEDGLLDDVGDLPVTARPPVDYVESLAEMQSAHGLLVVDAPAATRRSCRASWSTTSAPGARSRR